MVSVQAEHIGRFETRALGTRIVLLTARLDAVEAAAPVLNAELAWVDALASRFRSDSELSRMNAGSGRLFRASADLIEALTVALRAARLTSGLVTPTVGAALLGVGYDRDFAGMVKDQAGELPPPVPVPNWSEVELDTASLTVRVPPGVQIDLGATAKAWAADRIAHRLAMELGCGVLVSLGGDMSIAGAPPPEGWIVGIADACDAEPGDIGEVVCLRDGGLATSGTQTRSWRRGGRSVHHLLDPGTGLSVESPWRTASVVAANCVDANIAATAAIIKGSGARAWLSGFGLPARLVDCSGGVVTLPGWPTGPGS